jgi:hemoglobin/transferrin/lactoferrin receptor protein
MIAKLSAKSALLLFISTHAYAEERHNTDTISMPHVTVVAARLQSTTLKNANTLYSIDKQELEQTLPRNLPEALMYTPGVMVQKTSNGQGAPFIRGFTGYRTLALIDGVRYNNSVYRDGPNEYFSLIDIYTMDSLELLNGPASALYGSDAIGGTLNLQTRSSHFHNETEDELFIHGSHQIRYSTAENSMINRTEFDVGQGQKWGLVGGYSDKNFGNIEAADLGKLPYTGYDEHAFDLKLDVTLNNKWDLTLAHQNLEQNDVWRTHSTIYSKSFSGTEIGSDLRRLKDQKRQLNYLTLVGYDFNSVIDQATLTLSHQQWQEDGERVRSSGASIDENFDSNMYGIDLQLESHYNNINFTYGFDYYQDNVDSGRTDYLANGAIDAVRVQGPIGDDATFSIFGSYIQAKLAVTNRLSVSVSSRYSYVDVDIGRFEDPDTSLAASYQSSWSNISSAIKASYTLTEDGTKSIWAGVSQSFRAPNVADISRYGGSRSNETEVAALGLSPEKFLTYETGFKLQQQHLAFNATYYYTDINDYVTSTPTGNTVGGLVEVSKQNSAEGYIHGIEADINYQWSDNVNTYANITWLEGYLSHATTTGASSTVTEPFSRIMPMTTRFGVEWKSDNKQWWLGSNLILAAKADTLSEGDKGDTQRIPPGGTPAYQLVNVYSGWQAHPHLLLTLQLNNLTDEAYRSHGSGSNEPGRNLILGAKVSF